LDGALAEFVSRQRHRLPFGTAPFHKPAIVFQLDGKEHESISCEIVDISAVKIDVNVPYLVGKNKNSSVVRAENLLPPGQTINIIRCNPAFKAG
jgi:hypothetical protein